MTAKTYPHDRFLAATLLKLVPKGATPNQITVLRMFMTPAVVWFLYLERYDAGIPLLLLAGLTDMLDGSLARTRDQVTEWGMIWDPIADKLLIGSVALLMMTRHFPIELTVVVLGLEALLLAGGLIRKVRGKTVAANWWGKFKMLFQVAGAALFLVSLQTGVAALATASYAAFGVACVLAAVSLSRHGL